MEPAGDRTGGVNKGDEPAQDKATERTAATSLTVTPRRGLRERGACRSRTAVRASLTEVNGAASGPQSSGRVLRDRSTRAVPAWLKDTKSEDEDEPSPDTGATKRRKVSNPRRKKPSECGEAGGGVAGDRLRGTEYVLTANRAARASYNQQHCVFVLLSEARPLPAALHGGGGHLVY